MLVLSCRGSDIGSCYVYTPMDMFPFPSRILHNSLLLFFIYLSLVLQFWDEPIVVSDASIKNHVATSISHIHSYDKPVIKTIHKVVNITTTEAELFAIWCGINQAVVITDSLHAAKRIFDSLPHPYQIQSAAISHELRDFFLKDVNNRIEFWDCPSKQKWPLHALVDKDSKSFVSTPIFPCKSSWNYCKKWECNSILSQWKMSFQVADLKGNFFLELLDNDLNPIEPSTAKGGPWLQHFSLSNLLYARAFQAIVNHALISKYCLKFFPREDFLCLCSLYPIETRWHILHECKRFNRYWNSSVIYKSTCPEITFLQWYHL